MTIKVKLTADEARALAALTKRFGPDDAERLANAYDGGREANAIYDAVLALRDALANAGNSPR